MSEVTNSDLLNALIDIKGDLGELKASSQGTREWLAQHVKDDQTMAADLRTLQRSHDRQRGAIKVLGIIGSAIGAGVGYIIERFTVGHH